MTDGSIPKTVIGKYLGMDEATIEDLTFGLRPSRVVDEVDLRVCLSWGQALSRGFVLELRQRYSASGRQGLTPAAAEKDEGRMALKI